MDGQTPKYGQGNPDAIRVAPGSSLVWALRGIPYTASTAAADVIDNSIAARAKHIWILSHSAHEPMDSYIAFVDDGHGMSEGELHKAMIHGSKDPRMDRGEGDFGRFGLGLKTASLSQGKRLTVWSKRHGKRIASQLNCGMVAINSTFSFAAISSVPFGGVKDSGYGRVHGPEGLLEYTYPRTVVRTRFNIPLKFLSFKRRAKDDKLVVKATKILKGRLG